MSPLVILVAFSAAAIGGLAFLLHRLGYSKTEGFADDAGAKAAFSAEFPEFSIERVARGSDGKSAIMVLDNTPALGIVHTMGHFNVAKMITPADMSRCEQAGQILTMHFNDFADPLFRIKFATEDEARHWNSLFQDAKGATSHA